MLILTRKADESIIIGNDVVIKVLKVQGNQVHIGINAPRDISVYRHEIYTQVMNENKKAVQKTAGKNQLAQLEKNLQNFRQLIKPKANKDNKDDSDK